MQRRRYFVWKFVKYPERESNGELSEYVSPVRGVITLIPANQHGVVNSGSSWVSPATPSARRRSFQAESAVLDKNVHIQRAAGIMHRLARAFACLGELSRRRRW